MGMVQWGKDLSVNVAEIDRQHQQLIQMINTLDDAMRKGKGKEALGQIVDGLIRYTGTHFSTEEKYFDRFGYPDASPHKKTHADFVGKVSVFREGFGKGQLGLSIEIMNFLSDWLKTHIMGSDKKYGPFLNSKGLK